jgi:phage-related protein
MARVTRDVNLPGRLAELADKIQKMKAELARGMETDAIEHIMELGVIIHRHAEIQKRVKSLGPVASTHEPAAIAGLADDLAGIERSLRNWIARLGKKRRPKTGRGSST